ncbi:hypothetical protein KY289_008448 [Solanum tuberosum]|nr:hypothetical protein KY289_008448 [Solanum tuberosum]
MEQHIIICEVRNLKREGSELLHICAYSARLLQLPKLALRLIDDVVREEGLLELFPQFLLGVDGAHLLPYLGLLAPLP